LIIENFQFSILDPPPLCPFSSPCFLTAICREYRRHAVSLYSKDVNGSVPQGGEECKVGSWQ
jgi:hypothetical protein